ncbi:MAG: DedA family protein [Patescibacteria group bacterium]
MVDPTVFIDYIDQFSYGGIFLIALLSGHLIPFPEDIILLVAGYLASAGFVNPYYAGGVALIGILIGDTILYRLSRSNSRLIHRMREHVRLRLIVRESLIKKHIRKVIFFSRFVPFFRSLGPVISGILKVPRKTFQLYNFLGMAIYVPLTVSIGYVFGSHVNSLVEKADAFRHGMFIFLIVVLGISLAVWANRKLDEI